MLALCWRKPNDGFEKREHKCIWQKTARNESDDISSNLVSW